MKVKAVEVDNLGQENQKITPIEVEPVTPVEPPKDPATPAEPSEPPTPAEPVTPIEPTTPVEPTPVTDDAFKAYIKEKYNIDSLDEVLESKNKETPQISEEVSKYLDWKKEKGGGSMSDYINVTKDWSKSTEDEIINAYMKQSKPHLDSSEIDFEINRMFTYDVDVDTEADIMAKNIAKKDLLKVAKDFFDENSKNFTPSRLGDAEVPTEYKEALTFKQSFDESQSVAESNKKTQRDLFNSETDRYFSNDFKGFDFKIGEKETKTYQPSNIETLKTNNSDLTNMLKKYVDESGAVTDVAGYHRAIAIATDPDSFAKFFYDEGKSDGVTDIVNTSKNRKFTPSVKHDTHDEGSSIRRVDISNSEYKFKLKQRK